MKLRSISLNDELELLLQSVTGLVRAVQSGRTTLRLLHTSTEKVVCRNSPATSSFGVGRFWGHFVPFTFRVSSTVRPISCHELRSRENGDSIPRRSNWFVDVSEALRFASPKTSHCQLFYSLTEGKLRKTEVSPSESSHTDIVQSQGGRGAGLARCALLAQPDLVPGTDAPSDSPSLADSSEEGSTDSETGQHVAPASRPLETPCLVPGWDAEVLGDLP